MQVAVSLVDGDIAPAHLHNGVSLMPPFGGLIALILNSVMSSVRLLTGFFCLFYARIDASKKTFLNILYLWQ